jgi:hypothetical protein
MKRILLLLLTSALLLSSGAAVGQGVTTPFPAIMSQVPQPIAGLIVGICLDTATGTPCTPTLPVFSDKALSVPIVSLQTDGDGLIPTFFIAPGQYQWCASDPVMGRIAAYCTKFSAPSVGGSSPSYVNLTVTATSTLAAVTATSINNSGNETVGGTLTAPNVNGVITVDGTHYPRTDAGIQSAINDCPNGGTVFLPTGTYTVNTGNILINKPLTLAGAGKQSTLLVGASLGATIDIILVQPPVSGDGNFIRLHDFAIQPVSGNPGRHAIHLSGANAFVQNVNIERMYIPTKLGGNAIFADGSGLAQGTPAVSTFVSNVLAGGIVMTNAGDAVRILRNQMIGAGPAIDVSFQTGASSLIVDSNNIGSDGGIHIGTTSITTQITRNEIESQATFTGSNGALLDIDGTTGSHVQDIMIQNNSFQVVNAITADAIRVNFADRALIVGNRFGRGAGASHDITVTANASQTSIGTNIWASGGPIASMINNSGTNTTLAGEAPGFTPGFLLGNGASLKWVDDAGTARGVLQTDSGGAVFFNGFHGDLIIQSASGANYLYDGTNPGNIALASSSAASSVPAAGTFVSLQNLVNVTTNGGQWLRGSNSELLTLSTVGSTTDTAGNLLPANSIIESVVARVTTTITTATDWKLGDATQAARFTNANATLVAGTTTVGLNQADPTVASANLGPVQTSAAKVRVTTTGTPGAGVIRITVFYRQFVPPAN